MISPNGFIVDIDIVQFEFLQRIDEEVKPLADIIVQVVGDLYQTGQAVIALTLAERKRYLQLAQLYHNKLVQRKHTRMAITIEDPRIKPLSQVLNIDNANLAVVVRTIVHNLMFITYDNPQTPMYINETQRQLWKFNYNQLFGGSK